MFQQLANDLIINQDPGYHNQAMMEFGAMLCKPKIRLAVFARCRSDVMPLNTIR